MKDLASFWSTVKSNCKGPRSQKIQFFFCITIEQFTCERWMPVCTLIWQLCLFIFVYSITYIKLCNNLYMRVLQAHPYEAIFLFFFIRLYANMFLNYLQYVYCILYYYLLFCVIVDGFFCFCYNVEDPKDKCKTITQFACQPTLQNSRYIFPESQDKSERGGTE